MALKKLSTAEMITLTGPWVDSNHVEHKKLAAIPEVRGLLPRVETAHDHLLELAGPVADTDGVLAAEAKQVDDRHDNLARGIFHVLLGFAFLTKKAKDAGGYLRLQEFLLPEGIKITQKSYREEAGHSAVLSKAIKPEHKHQLGEIAVPGGTLRDSVDEWISCGKKLGELEDQRVAEATQSNETAAPSALVKARNQWIRAVNAVVSTLELVDADDATTTLVLARVRDTERRADRRSTSGADEVAAPAPAPAKADA